MLHNATPEARLAGLQSKIARNAGVLAALTMVSRVAGLVRDFAITHFFGATGTTDVFYMAFTIPNVLRRLVAEGTLTAVVQPSYQKIRDTEGDKAAADFFAGMLGVAVVIIGAVCVAGVVGAPILVHAFAEGFAKDPEKFAWCVTLTRWLFPSVFAMTLMGLAQAVLNAHDRYAVPALAPIVLNISMITGTVLGATLLTSRPIFGVVGGVLVGGVLQVMAQVPSLASLRLVRWPEPRFSDPKIREALAQFIPGLFGLAVYQVNILVLRRFASDLGDGAVSYYYSADRLIELTNGVFAIAVAQGAFSSMNTLAGTQKWDELKGVWRFSFELSNLIAIPAALGLAVLSQPIVSVLFLHGKFTWEDVEQTALNVMCASFGLVFASTVRAGVQMFFAMGDRRTPAAVSAVIVVVNAAVGWYLVRFGIQGLSATLAVSSAVQAILLVVLLRARLGSLGLAPVLRSGLVKLLVAVVACGGAYGVALLGAWREGPTLRNVVVLGAAIGVAVVVYGAGAIALKLAGAEKLWAKVRSKVSRRSAPRA